MKVVDNLQVCNEFNFVMLSTNKQVRIKNIHLRYEDTLSTPGTPFALGAVIAEIQMCSVGPDWKPIFQHTRRVIMKKV